MAYSNYSVAITTPAAGAGAAYAQLIAPPVANTPMVAAITEISCVLDAATASSIGLIIGATNGTPSTSVGGLDESNLLVNALVPKSLVASAWSVAATLAGTAIYLRKVILPAIAGASVTWTWSERSPLIIPNAKTLLLWNFGVGGGSALSCTIKWSEAQGVSGQRVVYANSISPTL